MSSENAEHKFCEAINLLSKRNVYITTVILFFTTYLWHYSSVCAVPCYSFYSGGEEPSTKHELNVFTHQIVDAEYARMLETHISAKTGDG